MWLVFHLSFMHLNLYSPKSYTYVLKCLQKSQISPLQLQVPYEACFLLKKKYSEKCILSQSLSHLALQKIIREVCFPRQKYLPFKNLPSFPVSSEKIPQANTTAGVKSGQGASWGSAACRKQKWGQKYSDKELQRSGTAIGWTPHFLVESCKYRKIV